jgi:dihydroxyacetone synthase
MKMSPSAIQEIYTQTPAAINGIKAVNGVRGKPSSDAIELAAREEHDLVLRTFRCLIADLCEQFKGGHPGYVLIY